MRVLKGVFARDELSMTHADLGLSAPDPTSPPALQQGQYLLLLLARNSRNPSSFSCVSAANWAPTRQMLPALTGPADPIVSMTESLIQVTHSPSRQKRADLLLQQVQRISGPALVPLLSSLSDRPYWAAQTASAKTLVRLMADKSPAIRAVATNTVLRILETGTGNDDDTKGEFAAALRSLLESEDVETSVRVSALRAVGHLGPYGRNLDWAGRLLVEHLNQARTLAERLSAASALADLNDPQHRGAALESLERLPLDEPKKREQSFVDEIARFAGKDAGPVLVRRLQRKLAAGHAAFPEIAQLGQLQYDEAVPLLLQAGIDGADSDELQLATAFEKLRDKRTVDLLVQWLQHANLNVRWAAFGALDAIDSDEAVAAIRLRLKSEPDLRLKLRMAATLGRHGIADGYPFAIEHLADPGVTEYAAKALAAIGDQRANKQLREILETSHDQQWNAAAMHGLAVLRDPSVKQRLLDILGDRRHPQLAAVITAAQAFGDSEFIPALSPLVSSRNYNVASVSIQAIKELAAVEEGRSPSLEQSLSAATTQLLTLLDDPDVDVRLRIAALDTLVVIEDGRLSDSVKRLADRSELENTKLMQRIDQYLVKTANAAG